MKDIILNYNQHKIYHLVNLNSNAMKNQINVKSFLKKVVIPKILKHNFNTLINYKERVQCQIKFPYAYFN